MKEEEKEEKKEEKKEKDVIKKEEREREKDRERERLTRGGVMKEERERPSSSSQPEELAGERPPVVGGSKRKELEQLKIVKAELK